MTDLTGPGFQLKISAFEVNAVTFGYQDGLINKSSTNIILLTPIVY